MKRSVLLKRTLSGIAILSLVTTTHAVCQSPAFVTDEKSSLAGARASANIPVEKANIPLEKVIRLAQQQYAAYISTHADTLRYPRDTKPDGTLGETGPADWTSGFFPGCLWYLYRFTSDDQWKAAADRWTRGLASQQYNTGTHDLGFMLYNSYGNGYELTKDSSYRSVLLHGATSLSTRFHPQVGAIRSWDNPDFHYPVIIDNLMNLEYLFHATALSGDSSFYKIALTHANTDLRYRFRPDNSSYHVLDFDPVSGQLLRRMTHQGYSDSSCWARGQAWGIYGYTVLYRETHDPRFLQRAILTADYFLSQTDKIPDHIPHWDFQAPDTLRDASAAAVAASALLELSRYAGRKYQHKAEELLAALCTDRYLAQPGTNNYFLLKHSTGHKPHNSEIDVPIIYADYYFLEALWRYHELQIGSSFVSPQKGSPQPSPRPATPPDLGNGLYRNPVLYADYSDPDVIRVGNDFYLTSSSFSNLPGLPILHSRDLVHWTIIGHALPCLPPEEVYDHPQPGKGVWAPAIRWHKDEFYIYYPDPDYGIFVVRSKSPRGPWSKPQLVVGGKGLIDPCPLFEADGKVWLINAWAASRAEVNSLLTIRPLDAAGLHPIGDAHMVFDGHDHQPTVEGPKLYRRHGYYYIFAPAGGVTSGWQLVLRSKNIYGPYEERIVMDQGNTAVNGPHQGAWVETPTGGSWFLHFQDKGPYGRIVHLEPMRWANDWPVIGNDPDGDGKGEPVATNSVPIPCPACTASPQTSDEFNSDAPGLQWQWQANPQITWSAEIPGSGHLRLFAIHSPAGSNNLWTVPNLLLQKFPAPDFTATTSIRLNAGEAGKKAGLLVMGTDYAYIAVQRKGADWQLVQNTCVNADTGAEEHTLATADLPADSVYLRVTVTGPNAQCRFSYSTDGKTFTDLGTPFLAKPGRWIGAKVGLFCLSAPGTKNGGYADFDWFRIEQGAGRGAIQIAE